MDIIIYPDLAIYYIVYSQLVKDGKLVIKCIIHMDLLQKPFKSSKYISACFLIAGIQFKFS